MNRSVPTLLVVGPSANGAVEYGLDLAEAVDAESLPGDVEIVVVDDPVEALVVARDRERVHVHATDAAFGRPLETAALRIAAICSATRASVTLHDLPQESDGRRNLSRRSEAYRLMVASAVGVAVSSAHERDLARQHLDGLEAAAIPLGTRVSRSPGDSDVEAADGPGFRPSAVIDVAVAGYVYPGKGHDDVIRAAGIAARSIGGGAVVTALGGVAPGHARDLEDLERLASDTGVEFRTTGWLDADEYRRRCRTAGVPVVAHRHYSASRSLLDWAELGRRPIVVDTRYTREMATLRPGTLSLVAGDVEALARAIEAAAQDPATTVVDAGHPVGPTLTDAARLYLDWWETLPW